MDVNQIRSLCVKYSILDYTINDDGSIDVEHSVDLSYALSNMSELPLKFNKVNGSFDCSNNNLETLEGSPKYVKNMFNCSRNKLTNLHFASKKSESFVCNRNMITSLEGCPESVEKLFYCQENNLTTLKGGPESVGMEFSCWNNDLSSLEGCPKYVGKDFDCSFNEIVNLKHTPDNFKNFTCNNTPIGSMFAQVDYDFIDAFKRFKIIEDDKVNLKRLKYIMEIFDKPIIIKRIEKYYKIV
jgi:hypothetical protein